MPRMSQISPDPTRETTFAASSCGTLNANILRMEDIMGREENKAVFENTVKLCNDNPKLNELVKKSVENQKLFPESLSLPEINTARYNTAATIHAGGDRKSVV